MGNVFKILTFKQIDGKAKQFPRRYTIEINNNKKENWIVHIHYRDLRLEMTVDEFKKFAEGVRESYDNLRALQEKKEN